MRRFDMNYLNTNVSVFKNSRKKNEATGKAIIINSLYLRFYYEIIMKDGEVASYLLEQNIGN